MNAEDAALYDEITQLASSAWRKSLGIEGLNTDPKMISIMLFRRLWSNHRGYTVTFRAGLDVESDIILRSGVEAAICIAANAKMGTAFGLLLRQDAIHTLQGQIKGFNEAGDAEMVRQAEAMRRELWKGLPEGTKGAKLDWKGLAAKGDVPQLYGMHRMLSGVSSHVTGMSIMRGVVSGDETDLQDQWRDLTRAQHPIWMMGATLYGSLVHAGMIDDAPLVEQALALVTKLDDLTASKQW